MGGYKGGNPLSLCAGTVGTRLSPLRCVLPHNRGVPPPPIVPPPIGPHLYHPPPCLPTCPSCLPRCLFAHPLVFSGTPPPTAVAFPHPPAFPQFCSPPFPFVPLHTYTLLHPSSLCLPFSSPLFFLPPILPCHHVSVFFPFVVPFSPHHPPASPCPFSPAPHEDAFPHFSPPQPPRSCVFSFLPPAPPPPHPSLSFASMLCRSPFTPPLFTHHFHPLPFPVCPGCPPLPLVPPPTPRSPPRLSRTLPPTFLAVHNPTPPSLFPPFLFPLFSPPVLPVPPIFSPLCTFPGPPLFRFSFLPFPPNLSSPSLFSPPHSFFCPSSLFYPPSLFLFPHPPHVSPAFPPPPFVVFRPPVLDMYPNR